MVPPKAHNARVEDNDPFWKSINLNLLTKVTNEHVCVLTSCSMASFATTKLTTRIVVVWPLELSVEASWPSVAGGASAPIASTFNIDLAG